MALSVCGTPTTTPWLPVVLLLPSLKAPTWAVFNLYVLSLQMRLFCQDGQTVVLELIGLIILNFCGRLIMRIRVELLLFVWVLLVSLSALVEWKEISECGRLDLESWSRIWKNTLAELLEFNSSLMILICWVVQEISQFWHGIWKLKRGFQLNSSAWVDWIVLLFHHLTTISSWLLAKKDALLIGI